MSNLKPWHRILMRFPSGVSLSGRDAELVIKDWKREKSDVNSKQWDFERLADKVEKRLKVLDDEVINSAGEVRKARLHYKKSTTPIAQRRWARRLVIANELHKYNRNSKHQLEVMVERVRDAIEDSKLVTRLIESRISDAEIYFQLNGRLRLVGKDLAAATREYSMPEIELKGAELSIEQIEQSLSGKSDDALLLEAGNIMATPLQVEAKQLTEGKEGKKNGQKQV